MKNSTNKLENICNKYCSVKHNEDNFSIGGGLDGEKFASRRHEDAREDGGKLTLGEATQLFKKATGLDINTVREVLEYTVPNMEWHHAGKLPKSYGGGMKKTYFLNASEICECAKNWDENILKLNISKAEKIKQAEEKQAFESRKLEFLNNNAKSVRRIANQPTFFYETDREMNGKYGWFSSYEKNYTMTEYYSGWEFETEEKKNEFLTIQP